MFTAPYAPHLPHLTHPTHHTLHTLPYAPPHAHHPISTMAGYKVNCLGGETELDVRSFSYSGAAKRSLRQPIERARKVRCPMAI